MINNIKKIITTVILWCMTLFILFMMGNYLYNDNEFVSKGKQKDFISYDAKKNGVKAMYLLAGEMGYSVKRYEKPARFLDKYKDYTMIIIAPDMAVLDNGKEMNYLIKWVEAGNSAIFYCESELLEDLVENFRYKDLLKNPIADIVNGYYCGLGKLILSTDTTSFSNSGVTNLDNGVEFIKKLEATSHNKILFNEFYHGIGDQGSVWDMFSSSGQIIIVQLFFAIFIFLFIKSRRFGKPEIVYQTVKRIENERLYALSKIYKRAKLLRGIFNIYVIRFEKDLFKYLEINNNKSRKILLEATKNNKILNYMKVYETIQTYDEYLNGLNLENVEIIALIKSMDNVKKELNFILKGNKGGAVDNGN